MVAQPTMTYPDQARRAGLTGAGVVLAYIDPATGVVTRTAMEKSTGHAILDRAAMKDCRKARFAPGTSGPVRIPIAYAGSGGVGERITYHYQKKSMDEIFGKVLGKGTIVKGEIPDYPHSEPWTFKEGKGVYELHVAEDGTVEKVNVLQSSGDEIFDRVTKKTLRKWRLRRGPTVLELPLGFRLTPDEYTVDLSR